MPTVVHSIVLALMTVAGTNGAAHFSTTIVPEPTYNGMAIVVLPTENNTNISVECVAYQHGDLRITFWFVQRVGGEIEGVATVDAGGFAVFSGETRNILTIVIFPQDLHHAVILCGPIDNEVNRRFLLTFAGN